MIDTHCHIDFDEFDEDRVDVIARAKERLNAVIIKDKLLFFIKMFPFVCTLLVLEEPYQTV